MILDKYSHECENIVNLLWPLDINKSYIFNYIITNIWLISDKLLINMVWSGYWWHINFNEFCMYAIIVDYCCMLNAISCDSAILFLYNLFGM